MSSERLVKGIYKWKPLGARTAGRPNSRWEYDVTKSLKLLKIGNWEKFTQNREEWKKSELSKNEVVIP
jgi:hypothetical protein